MRALAVFPERRELRMVDIPAPTRRSDREVTVRIREVGVCGTDREIGAFQYGAPALQRRLVRRLSSGASGLLRLWGLLRTGNQAGRRFHDRARGRGGAVP